MSTLLSAVENLLHEVLVRSVFLTELSSERKLFSRQIEGANT